MTEILIVSDAWRPQINGVVRTFERMLEFAPAVGVEMSVLGPDRFKTIPCPTYPEIRLALTRQRRVARMIEAANPKYLHIATEGPLGLMARHWAIKNEHPFTTSYHTRFPEYLAARFPVPTSWTYHFIRWFHNSGNACMVTTKGLEEHLIEKGILSLRRWPRGVDHRVFCPRPEIDVFDGLPRPIFTYVGRVSVEKNLEAFLDLDLPGTKVIVGDGPALPSLKAKYKTAHFTGAKVDRALAEHYSSSDVFVFPSRTDTYGIVLLEALSAGVPVAAYPVLGPKDVVGGTDVAVLSENLQEAALEALKIPRERCRAFALEHSWEASVEAFVQNVRDANETVSAKSRKKTLS